MRNAAVICLINLLFAICAQSQTTEFTYQGSLNVGTPPGTPANTPHDFEFRLFTAESGGSQLGTLQERLNVPVANGVFSVRLNFGNQFQGVPRWLEIRVKPLGGPTYTLLNPRQKVSPTPESIFTLNSDNAAMLGGVAANQYLTTTSANTNYIQNTTTTQASSNFNISGNGTVGGAFRVGGIAGGIGGSFSSGGRFEIDAPFSPGGRFRVLENGNVGVGTAIPATKFHVSGAGIVRARVNSDSNAGLQLSLGDAGKWSVATTSPGNFQIFNDAIGQNALTIDSATNTVNIDRDFGVNGYTKLGSDAPSIKMKKLTGTTSSGPFCQVVPHGLDNPKILAVSVMVNSVSSQWISPSNVVVPGCHFAWHLDSDFIHVCNVSNQSAQIQSKPIKILITYEQ